MGNDVPKRLFDLFVSFGLIVFTAPFLLILLLVIRLESKGAPLYVQTRLGKNQQPFNCLKLRTMYIDAPIGSTHTIPSKCITRFGRFLRKSKLDELPQLLNVISGSMSLVGPRPCLPTQSTLIAEREKRGVFKVRPGITGLAQVKGVGTTNAYNQASLDSKYVKTSTFFLDMKILLITVTGQWEEDDD